MKKGIGFILLIPVLLFAVIVLLKNRAAVLGSGGGGGGGGPVGGVGLLPNPQAIVNNTGKPLAVSGTAVGGIGTKVINTMQQSFDDLTKQQEARDDAYAKGLLTKAVTFNVYGLVTDIADGLKSFDKKQEERIALLVEYAKAGDPRARLQLSAFYPDLAKANGVYAIGKNVNAGLTPGTFHNVSNRANNYNA
jgi:hypothetical protein